MTADDGYYTIRGKKTAEWHYTMAEDGTETITNLMERGSCRNCQRTFDGCVNAHGDHWLPCCSNCDHP